MHQERWIAGTSTLLAVFQAMRGDPPIDPQPRNRRTGPFSQRWPGVLTGLSSVEAAMLQDLTWWGPLMEHRLKQMADIGTDIRSDR
ncbi:MAG: hypothetical protein OJF47_001230 [Nitrospira sp.]|jgi:hypothetical protein|nr:MAG: hypothetical protein OJF47_001230 [Nitrospira sp.]